MDTDVPYEFTLNAKEVQALLADRQQAADSFEKYYPLWTGIFGWLDKDQAEWLFSAAKNNDPSGEIVEIGSAFGRSTICLGLGARLAGSGRVHAVDPHTGDITIRKTLEWKDIEYSSREGFLRNISRFDLNGTINPIVMTSEEAVALWPSTDKIKLLFVDGWHTYEAVFHDITAWAPFIAPGGKIAAHDYSQKSIRNAIHDSIDKVGGVELTKIGKNMVFFSMPKELKNETASHDSPPNVQ